MLEAASSVPPVADGSVSVLAEGVTPVLQAVSRSAAIPTIAVGVFLMVVLLVR